MFINTYNYARIEGEEVSFITNILEEDHLEGMYTSPEGRKVGKRL